MTWNYQILKHMEPDGRIWFGLHEVYRDEDGAIDTWTKYPFTAGESARDVILDLKLMLKDANSRSVAMVDEERAARNPSSLKQAIELLLDSEDSTGCDGDLTVVSLSAVETIRKLFRGECHT